MTEKFQASLPQVGQQDLAMLAMLVWKFRHHLPALVVQVTPADIKGLQDTLAYNGQTLQVNVDQRGENILIHLTDAATGDQIIATENNEADLERAQAKANRMSIKQNAPQLAAQLRNDAATGNFSTAIIEEACHALDALSR